MLHVVNRYSSLEPIEYSRYTCILSSGTNQAGDDMRSSPASSRWSALLRTHELAESHTRAAPRRSRSIIRRCNSMPKRPRPMSAFWVRFLPKWWRYYRYIPIMTSGDSVRRSAGNPRPAQNQKLANADLITDAQRQVHELQTCDGRARAVHSGP